MDITNENGFPRVPTDRRAFPDIKALNYELTRLTREDPLDEREADREALRQEISARQTEVSALWTSLADAGFKIKASGEPLKYRVEDPNGDTRSIPEMSRAVSVDNAREIAVKYLRSLAM
jgi:hypothetical protein